MKIEIGADIKIIEAPGRLLGQIMTELTCANPEYEAAERRGYSTWGIPRKLRLYQAIPGGLRVPRGYMRRLIEIGPYVPDVDARANPPMVGFGSRIALRDYQQEAVMYALRADDGVIVAPPGAGKTIIGLALVDRLQRPALWLTHTKDLADQTESRAREHLADVGEIGRLGDGQWTVGDKLTIGMIQTLASRDLGEVAGLFGTVIVDECHHVPCRTAYEVVNALPARYRYGLTATPERADGLEFYLFAGIGPIVHRIGHDALAAAGQIIVPEVRLTYTDFTYDSAPDGDRLNWHRLMGELIQDEARNRLITDTIVAHAAGHFSLVLSDRQEHCMGLRWLLRAHPAGQNLRAAVIHGQLPRGRRREIMAQAAAGELDVLFATQLAREGLDLPRLDRLHVATPKRAAGAVEQEAGRVARPAPGKTGAIIFDYVDDLVGTLRSQASARRQVYRKLGCTVPRKGRDVAARQVEQYLSLFGGGVRG